MFIEDYVYTEGGVPFDVADGEHPVVIRGAQIETSKNGNRMIKVQLDVPDGNGGVFTHCITEGEYFNNKMSRFFDAFAIRPGDFNFAGWKLKGAMAQFEHEEKDGKMFPRIKFFVSKKTASAGQSAQAGHAPGAQGAQTRPAAREYLRPEEMKGGPATREENAELNRLISSKYANGVPVFSEDEKRLYRSYRRDMTAQELIDFIKHALQSRIGGNGLSDANGSGATAWF